MTLPLSADINTIIMIVYLFSIFCVQTQAGVVFRAMFRFLLIGVNYEPPYEYSILNHIWYRAVKKKSCQNHEVLATRQNDFEANFVPDSDIIFNIFVL